jgi:hypothetical protein
MLLVQDQLLLSPDCSRLPGFKSSLNHVQLKIHHALKETSYLTDGRNDDSFGAAWQAQFRRIFHGCKAPEKSALLLARFVVSLTCENSVHFVT